MKPKVLTDAELAAAAREVLHQLNRLHVEMDRRGITAEIRSGRSPGEIGFEYSRVTREVL